MRPTIRDVAELAGVSTATVSHVITKKKYVSEELEHRIKDAMNTLGYKPNTIARSLKIKRSYIIGVTVPDIANPFFAEIVEHIQKNAGKHSYRIMLYNADDSMDAEKKAIDGFLSAGVDGIISVAPRLPDAQLDKAYGVPLVVVDRPSFETQSNIGFVFADNYAGAVKVADYLVSHDYRRFACFAGPVDTVPNAKERLNGFVGRLKDLGFTQNQYQVHYCEYSFDSGNKTMKSLLDQDDLAGEKLAVFAPSDIMAWGAMEAIKTKGFKIPRDIALVGFDNIFYSNYLYPALSTVENPTKSLGENAVEMIIDAIENENSLDGKEIVLETTLIERDSI